VEISGRSIIAEERITPRFELSGNQRDVIRARDVQGRFSVDRKRDSQRVVGGRNDLEKHSVDK
jgi:hypothetical protein